MAIVDITCWNDADFIHGFVYAEQLPDGSVGPPIDLTGNTMRMGVRFHAEDVIEELQLTTENGGLTITDAPNGKFTVLITQTQLLQMTVRSYEHSLVRDTGTNTLRIWSGSL